jgi:hypothetical protein
MEKVFDDLIIKIIFTLLTGMIIYFYRYAHLLFYPTGAKQVVTLFDPMNNASDTLHYFSRIIGLGIVLLSCHIATNQSLFYSIIEFLIWSFFAISFYLLGLTILENIILSKFQYSIEILKRKNIAYALVNSTNALATAFIVKCAFELANHSIPNLLISWLFLIVLYALLSKQFHIISQYQFSKSIFAKDMGAAISYSVHLASIIFLIHSALVHVHGDILTIILNIIAKLLLCSIIAPIMFYAIKFIFLKKNQMTLTLYRYENNTDDESIAFGFSEAMLLITSTMTTAMIVFGIQFTSNFQLIP